VTSAETATPKPVEEPAKTRKRLSLSLVPILMAVACALYLWKGYPSHDKSLTIYDRLSLPEKPTEEVHEERAEPPNDQMEESTPQIPDPAFEDMSSPDVLFSEKAEGPFSTDPVSPLESGSVPEIEIPELTLKINVKEMTWVRIFVDDQGPKEYMFRPGNHLEWKATKGFEILIGNAGGIDLEFSGTEIKNLGGHGKVVRLRLPEDYERGIL
jgi:hypothetical protein